MADAIWRRALVGGGNGGHSLVPPLSLLPDLQQVIGFPLHAATSAKEPVTTD